MSVEAPILTIAGDHQEFSTVGRRNKEVLTMPEIGKRIATGTRELWKSYKNHEIRIDELGSATGRLLVRALDSIHSRENNFPTMVVKKACEDLHAYYQDKFDEIGKEQYKKRRPGILGEFAAMKALEGYDIRYPSTAEDVNSKVDFFICLEEPTNEGIDIVAVQVKVFGELETSDDADLLFPVSSLEEVKGLSNGLGLRKDQSEQLMKSGEGLIDYCSRFDNVRAAIVILPAPSEWDRLNGLFDHVTGQPSIDMKRRLDFQLVEKVIDAKENNEGGTDA